MSPEVLSALVAYSFATSITPGPNNLMLLASGVNFGFRRTIPHMLGVGLGFAFMLLCVGAGLGALIKQYPIIHQGLKVAGVGYLLYLAWKIANSGPIEEKNGSAVPITFLQAAAFQWVNPKAWFMGITAMAVYTQPTNYAFTVGLVALVFALVNLPSVSLWCAMGTAMRQFLSDPQKLRIFNVTMALLLIASLWPMLKT